MRGDTDIALNRRPHLSAGRWNLRLHTLDSFRFKRFRHFWVAVLLSSGVQWLQRVVVGWVTYDVSQSPLLTVMAMGLGTLPYLVVAPLGGVLADRWDRGRLLAAVFASKGVVMAGFSVLVISGRAEVWHIFSLVLAIGLLQAISFPARQSIIPSTVPRDHLVNAFALTMLTSSALQLALPTVAGFSIAFQGPGFTLLAGAVMYLTAAAAAATIRLPRTDEVRARPKSFVSEFVDGTRYVMRDPVLLPVVLMGAAVYILIVPTVHGLLPVYASEVFDVGPVGLGLMGSALGVGSTLGALTLASLGTLRYKGRFMIGCLALTLFAAMAFSRSTSMVVALPLVMLVNVGFDSFATIRSTSIQMIAPNAMRGRATAVNSMGSGLSPLGGLVLGGTAELLGAPHATLIAAGIMVVCLLGITLRFREAWRFD